MKTYYPKLAKNQTYPTGTLCEFCRNAIPDNKGHGCPWSRAFQPVEGWIATSVSRLSEENRSKLIACMNAHPF